MTSPEFPAIVPGVDTGTANRNVREVAEEMAELLSPDNIKAAFPGYIVSPAVALPPRERFERYMLALVQAYPLDEAGRMQEMAYLLDPDYINLIQQALVPLPLSLPWSVLARFPRIFKDIQRDLQSTYKGAVANDSD